MQQHGEGKVMADCKALSQYGDKGSPPDGRPFTLDLSTVHLLKAQLSRMLERGFFNVFTLRTHMHAHTLAHEASLGKILSQGSPYGGILLLLV